LKNLSIAISFQSSRKLPSFSLHLRSFFHLFSRGTFVQYARKYLYIITSTQTCFISLKFARKYLYSMWVSLSTYFGRHFVLICTKDNHLRKVLENPQTNFINYRCQLATHKSEIIIDGKYKMVISKINIKPLIEYKAKNVVLVVIHNFKHQKKK